MVNMVKRVAVFWDNIQAFQDPSLVAQNQEAKLGVGFVAEFVQRMNQGPAVDGEARIEAGKRVMTRILAREGFFEEDARIEAGYSIYHLVRLVERREMLERAQREKRAKRKLRNKMMKKQVKEGEVKQGPGKLFVKGNIPKPLLGKV